MKHSSPTCSETKLGDFSFLLVANRNFAEKKKAGFIVYKLFTNLVFVEKLFV